MPKSGKNIENNHQQPLEQMKKKQCSDVMKKQPAIDTNCRIV